MSQPLEQLVATAESHANAGRWQEAESAWRLVHQQAPDHPKALFGLGFHALHRGDFSTSQKFLEAAVEKVPKDLMAWMTLATAYRESALPEQELKALDAALVAEPYCLPALLLKAAWMERNSRALEAAGLYSNCLKIAPQRQQWPPALASQLEHATRVVFAHRERYSQYLNQSLARTYAQLPAAKQSQWAEALSLFGGRTTPYTAQCNQLHVPRLPAIPFFERSNFPWLAQLEQHTDAIREELQGLLKDAAGEFSPYISYQPGQPVNQWAELNHSNRWSALHLWRGGERVEENIQRCPVTVAALEALPIADIGGLCPNVMFSALAPRTAIPPHHGETNARLVAHLPLIVPEGCRLRVGFEERSWTIGETLIFDDSIEHAAVNDSDELRVVMIFDVWNPLLGPEEKAMVQAMAAAARDYRA